VSEDRIADVAWTHDGRLLLAAGDTGQLHVVDTSRCQAQSPRLTSDTAFSQIEVLPDGRTVVLAGSTVKCFDLERGVVRSQLPAGVGQQAATYMVPDPA